MKIWENYLDSVNNAVSIIHEITDNALDLRSRNIFSFPPESVASSVFEVEITEFVSYENIPWKN